jgi:siroheme synthase
MGLITQRGKEVLLQAQVVLYDRLVNPGILLGTRPKTLFVDAGKTPRGMKMEQNEIHRLLIRFAKKGLNVVRLKGGDPYVFGRVGRKQRPWFVEGFHLKLFPESQQGSLLLLMQGFLSLTEESVRRPFFE